MLLAIDECTSGNTNVLGGILLPLNDLPNLEAEFVKLRVQHRLWGELKWNHINQYWKRYADFVELFFSNQQATFHAIGFRDGSKQYNAAYTLIKTITWKLQNAGFSNDLYVLFDENGSLGADETRKIREIASGDSKFKCNLSFCNQGSSHVIGALQIADLLTGSIHAEVNSKSLGKHQTNFFNFVKQKNGHPLSLRSYRLPQLNEQKIQYFDPDDRDRSVVDSYTDEHVINIPRSTTKEQLSEVGKILRQNQGQDTVMINVLGTSSQPARLLHLPYLVDFSEQTKTQILTILGN